MQVAGIPAYTDLSKAHEVANLVRRLQKDLRDAINDAGKYNNRERLFDMPITNVRIFGFAYYANFISVEALTLFSGVGVVLHLRCRDIHK